MTEPEQDSVRCPHCGHNEYVFLQYEDEDYTECEICQKPFYVKIHTKIIMSYSGFTEEEWNERQTVR